MRKLLGGPSTCFPGVFLEKLISKDSLCTNDCLGKINLECYFTFSWRFSMNIKGSEKIGKYRVPIYP